MRTTELEEKDQQAGLEIDWNYIKVNIQLVEMYKCKWDMVHMIKGE